MKTSICVDWLSETTIPDGLGEGGAKAEERGGVASVTIRSVCGQIPEPRISHIPNLISGQQNC